MTKSDVSEIKKTLDLDKIAAFDMGLSYLQVSDKSIRVYKKKFLSMAKNEKLKYLALFRKALSGPIDKNLHLLPIGEYEKPLLILSKNMEDCVFERVCEHILDTYDGADNLCVFMLKASYDVPTKTTDNRKIDESSEVYEHVLCAICPLKLTPPGLEYRMYDGIFGEITQLKQVQMPIGGFIYPAFTNRKEDVSHVLVYIKDESSLSFMAGIFGSDMPEIKKTPKDAAIKKVPKNESASASSTDNFSQGKPSEPAAITTTNNEETNKLKGSIIGYEKNRSAPSLDSGLMNPSENFVDSHRVITGEDAPKKMISKSKVIQMLNAVASIEELEEVIRKLEIM